MKSQAYTTLIIDDEPPARARLQKLLEHFPETFRVLDEAKNGIEAVEKINQLQPDVIFLDIEMPGLNGFELLERLEKIPIVIFCTAFDQYSLKAFETNSIDYLLKPVRLERLQQTVEKLSNFKNNLSSATIMSVLKEFYSQKEEKKMTSITVKKGEKLIFIKLDEVTHFEADEKYVTVYTNKENHLIEQSLSQLELKLPEEFIRVHRAVIVNKNLVLDVQKYFNSRFVITLNNNRKTSITSGRSYNLQIKNWMDI
ncbi:two component transcriptional regulator, LytTR family [Flavobacterium flevense]|uniref:DNA-binding response regulator n=1 Tax=Flavobacterium flevense TaxID=983 RepID=A0A4Y4ARR9_9FLAO|nr:LytTR family DNA-binding domain-containing protein [Flavobacterium flevense]GEC70916.1 DNA-binding response regulator [Flavobacterium flevense]SHL55449.1 two component transcriptional regulator, LytTR family [Flavobacterium flevense]